MNPLEPYQAELERNFRIAYLISQFIQENLSEEEEEELDQWIQQSDHNMRLFGELTDDATVDDFMKWYAGCDPERNLQEVKQRLHFRKNSPIKMILRYAAAASILLLLATGTYFLAFNNSKVPTVERTTEPADILAGNTSATLVLGDGEKIDLTNLKDTVISSEVRVENGAVVYNSTANAPEFHEIQIPRKGFYQLVLPDGSKVWINSGSSIRYPSRFTGSERRISVTGETYFEVAKDASRPFIVSVNGIDITAVGTAFNINAYPEEAGLKVTLTEGSVKVGNLSRSELLEPGNQLSIAGSNWTVSPADVSVVIAWTHNQFKLKNNTIEEVMRMVQRWYDAKVIFKDNVDHHFTGTIDRSVPVSRLLKLLSATGEVHFEITGDTIIVSH